MALRSMLPLMLGYQSLIWIIKQYQQATRSPKLDINPPLLIVTQHGGAELSRDLLIPFCQRSTLSTQRCFHGLVRRVLSAASTSFQL